MRFLKKGDFVVVGCIAFVWLAMLCAFFSQGSSKGGKAVIYLDGIEYASYKFENLKEPVYLTVEKYGRNVIEVSTNGVRVIETDCDDRLEVRDGYINKPNQSLICLPNRLVIKIEGGDAVDAVTY